MFFIKEKKRMEDNNDNDNNDAIGNENLLKNQMEYVEGLYAIVKRFLIVNYRGFRETFKEMRLQKLSDFDKWYFIQLIFSEIMEMHRHPIVIIERFGEYVRMILESGFSIFWTPEGIEYEMARRYGKRPEFEDQSLSFMVMDFLEKEKDSPIAITLFELFFLPFFPVPTKKYAGKTAAAAQYSRAQIINALRKSKGITTLAAARLLQRH